jgi:uncharacterized protein YbjT (DUF2867 family)
MANSILVVGATGKQGRAVIEALLASPEAKDITIFALTRHPDSASAKSLALKAPEKIKVVKGDLNDSSSIFKEVGAPVQAVFLVTLPEFGLWRESDGEEVKGKALVDAALQNGVKHIVFTSVDRGPDQTDTDVPHFISKAKIERHIIDECSKDSEATYTFLRPTCFMENMPTGFAGKIFPTSWKVGISPTRKLQLISTKDIGYFGAQALLRPGEYAGRAISLAGDDLTFEEGNKIFREETGIDLPVTYGFLISFALWMFKDVGKMFNFFDKVGYATDVEALRNEYPGLLSFRDWLKTSVWARKDK